MKARHAGAQEACEQSYEFPWGKDKESEPRLLLSLKTLTKAL